MVLLAFELPHSINCQVLRVWSVFKSAPISSPLPPLSSWGLGHLSSTLLQLVTETPFPLSLAPAFLFKCISSRSAHSTASIHPECFQFPEYNLSFQVCMVCWFSQYFYLVNTCSIFKTQSVSPLQSLPSHPKHGWSVSSLRFTSICVFTYFFAYLSSQINMISMMIVSIDNNSNTRSSNLLDAYNVPYSPLALYNLYLYSL